MLKRLIFCFALFVGLSINVALAQCLTISSTQVDVSCFGGNDGQITLNITPGNFPDAQPPYSIDLFYFSAGLTPLASHVGYMSNTITFTPGNLSLNLPGADAQGIVATQPGDFYQINVRSTGGIFTCRNKSLLGILVSEPTVFTASTSQTNVSCFGGNDGTITVAPTGGTAPYDFSIDGGATYPVLNVANHTFTTLTAGLKNIRVRDANNCEIAVIPVSLTEPAAAVTATTSQTNVACFGGNDGTITVTPAGGTAPYDFSIDGGATYPVLDLASHTFITLTAGLKSIRVRDANNCQTVVIPVTLTQPLVALTAPTSQTNLSCFSGNDGTITVTPAGGTAPYDFSIDGGITYPVLNLASHTFITLTAGLKNIRVRDANNCQTAIIPVTITQPPIFTASTSQTNVSCFGGNNGTITVTPSGGVAPYDFSINGGTTYTVLNVANNTFITLTAGLNNIRVRDANNCETAVIPVTITQPTLLTAPTSQANVSCFSGNDGTITVTPAGGIAPYDFSIDGGTTYPVLDLASHTFITLTAGLKSIRVRDANNCQTAIIPVTITQPTLLTAPTSQANVSCFGGSDGTITITPAGGTAPYDFSIDGGTTYPVLDLASHTFITLTAGLKNIRVRDANNCQTAIIPVTITQPPIFTASTSQTNVSCFGGNDGTITVTPSGGVAPYDFSIDGGTTYTVLNVANNTFITLTVGLNNIRVRDANNCQTAVIPVTITQPTLLTAPTSQANVSCFGGSDGTITITPAGGTAPYDYSIDGGTTYPVLDLASHTFITLTAGLKNIRVRDANNCQTAVIPVTLTEPALLTASTSKINVSCFGGNDGSVTITPAGGTSPYDFSIDGGVTYPALDIASHTFPTLTAGIKNIRVRDANNCETAIIPLTITQPAGALVLSNSGNVSLSCFGDTNGSGTFTASGGTSPYVIVALSNTTGGTVGTTATTLTLSNAGAGSITVQVTDNNNCIATNVITVTQPAILSLATSVTNVLCFGGSTGAIDLTVTGGIGPYGFVWSNAAITEDIIGLSANTYNVTVTDANGCTANTSAVVNAPASPVSVSVNSQVNVTCFGGNDGSIKVTAAGGTGPFEFSSDNGVSFIAGVNPFTFTALTAGPYTIVVRDANLCISPSTLVTLTSNPVITFTATPTVATCLGINDGKIDISGEIGGVGGPFTYSNDGGLSFVPSPNFISLAPNNYDMVIKDAAGCTSAVATVTVVSVTSITITTVNITDASCIGIDDGAIDVQLVTGGTGTYTYSLNGGAFAASPVFTLLAVGSYPVVVKDGNGCTSTPQNELVGSTLTITPTITKTDAACFANNGSIDISPVIGGTGPYQYSIDNGLSFQLSNTFNNLAPNVSPATYDVLVKDANSCLSSLINIVISQPAICVVGNCGVFAVIATNVRPTCANKNNGSITLDVSGGTSPYIVTLSRLVAGVPTSPQALPGPGPTFTFINLSPDDYQYSIQDAATNSCALPYTLLLQETVQAVASNFVDAKCFNEPVGQATLTVTSGGTSPYAYSVDNGANWLAFTSPMTVTNLPPSASPYSILVADDNAGLCSSQVSVTINNASSAPLDTLYVNRTISLPDLATGGMIIGVLESAQEPYEVKLELIKPLFPSQGFLLDWTPIVRNPLNLKFEYDARNLFAGDYQLSIRDNLRCEKNYIVTIKVDTNIAIPNIFTPNGDGVNDVFFIRNLPVETNVLITNRWGKEVFKAGDYQNDWTGGDTSDGLYYYRIVASDQVFTGWLEIQRGQ